MSDPSDQAPVGRNTISAICYGGGAILLIVALFGLGGYERWVMVPAAAALFVLGIQVQSLQTSQSQSQLASASEIDLLRRQVEENTDTVETLSDGLDVALFVCDARAHVEYANLQATEMFRIDNPSARSVLALTLSHDLEDIVFQTRKTGEPQTAEMVFTYPEERVAIVKAWSAGENDRVYLTIDDISDLRRLERVRQDFVANVSHELRTPLSIIRAMAETLLDQPEGDHELTERYLTKIISEVDRLSMITQDLLVLSASESNPIRKQTCDIADLFRSATEQLRAKAKDKGLEIIFEGAEHLMIEANAFQMTQVAINLIDNAINYTSAGWIHVKVASLEGYAEVRIEDSGIGIASDQLGRIFERFYRVDRARSRATGGTGLGLSIVKHLVEAHGGSISVESSLNQGTTFTLKLPVGNLPDTP